MNTSELTHQHLLGKVRGSVRGKLTPLRCVPLAKSHSQAVKNKPKKKKTTKKENFKPTPPWEWQQKLQEIAKNMGLIMVYISCIIVYNTTIIIKK
jgi:hypothetical protein